MTEHRAQAVCCPGCGLRTRAAFPAAVAGPVQFGPRLEALAVYLRHAQHLPVARTRALLRELHGVSLSTATVEALCRRADGTGWLHAIGDETVTTYRLGARGDVWEGYAGTAVHDRFARLLERPWRTRPVHALCNAHLLRNLEEIVELEKEPDGWAARMQRLLLEALGPRRPLARDDRRPGAGGRPRGGRPRPGMPLLAPALEHYESLPPPTRGRGRRHGHNLALALRKEREACLRFLADPAVPFTNNRAERALRMARRTSRWRAASAHGTGPSASPSCGAWSRPPASGNGPCLTSCGGARRRRYGPQPP